MKAYILNHIKMALYKSFEHPLLKMWFLKSIPLFWVKNYTILPIFMIWTIAPHSGRNQVTTIFCIYNKHKCPILTNMRWQIILNISYHSFWSKNTSKSKCQKYQNLKKFPIFEGFGQPLNVKISHKLFFHEMTQLEGVRLKTFKSC